MLNRENPQVRCVWFGNECKYVVCLIAQTKSVKLFTFGEIHRNESIKAL